MKYVTYFIATAIGLITGYLLHTGDMVWYHYIALTILIGLTVLAVFRVQRGFEEVEDLYQENKSLTETSNNYLSHIKDLDREIKMLEQMVIDASNANTKVDVDGGNLDD